jgi:hypothetical protein
LTTMVVSPVCGNFLHVGGSRRWLFVGNEIWNFESIFFFFTDFLNFRAKFSKWN